VEGGKKGTSLWTGGKEGEGGGSLNAGDVLGQLTEREKGWEGPVGTRVRTHHLDACVVRERTEIRRFTFRGKNQRYRNWLGGGNVTIEEKKKESEVKRKK